MYTTGVTVVDEKIFGCSQHGPTAWFSRNRPAAPNGGWKGVATLNVWEFGVTNWTNPASWVSTILSRWSPRTIRYLYKESLTIAGNYTKWTWIWPMTQPLFENLGFPFPHHFPGCVEKLRRRANGLKIIFDNLMGGELLCCHLTTWCEVQAINCICLVGGDGSTTGPDVLFVMFIHAW